MAIREFKLAVMAGERRHQRSRQQRRQKRTGASTHRDQSPQTIDWPTFETGDERVYDFNRNQRGWRDAGGRGFDREGIVSRVRNLPHLDRRSCVDLLLRLRNRPSPAQLQ
jgi:hypothetical protein